MTYLFWASVLVVVYVYAGYPLLVACWAAAVRRRPRKRRIDDDGRAWPAISIVLAARNEASRLPARIANLLELPYPGRREIIVVSDGSTDGTGSAVRALAGPIRLIELPRGGKPAALNAGVAAATGEILVFADARQRFSPEALVELVANFADPRVGGATGQLVLDCENDGAGATSGGSGSTIAEGVGLYWTYEKWLRRTESAVWSTLGATGAIYALRRSLWQPLPPDTLLDDVLAPMRAVMAGYRIVFEERARAYDRTSADAAEESRRKTRTLAGNYQILAQEPRLLLPVVNPVWLQYLSHKVGRLVVPWALVGALLASAALASASWFFLLVLAVQLAFYGLAMVGAWLEAHAEPKTTLGAVAPLVNGKTADVPPAPRLRRV